MTPATCHFGYSRYHLVFLLVKLGMLSWFLRATRKAGPVLRGLLCVGAAVDLVYHALLGAMCSSTAVSAVTSWLLGAHAAFRIRVLHGAVFLQVTLAPVALHFIRTENECTARRTKSVFMLGVCLTNMVLLSCWWDDSGREDIWQALGLSFLILGLSSQVFIYSATKSKAIALNALVLGPIMMGAHGILRSAFPSQPHSNRLVPMQPEDEVCARMYTHAYRHVRRHVHGHVDGHVYGHVYGHLYGHVYGHVCRPIYRHVYGHVYGHVCRYAYRHVFDQKTSCVHACISLTVCLLSCTCWTCACVRERVSARMRRCTCFGVVVMVVVVVRTRVFLRVRVVCTRACACAEVVCLR